MQPILTVNLMSASINWRITIFCCTDFVPTAVYIKLYLSIFHAYYPRQFLMSFNKQRSKDRKKIKQL